MQQNYQDAMAIVRILGKPDLFITSTSNPYWKEIISTLLPGQQPHDRPDIIARVFRLKLDQLIKDLKMNHLFGVPVAHLNNTFLLL
jgi:hypothetical protein